MNWVYYCDGYNWWTGRYCSMHSTRQIYLVPSKISLFPNITKFHAGKKYMSDLEVITSTNIHLKELDKLAYNSVTNGLEFVLQRLLSEKIKVFFIPIFYNRYTENHSSQSRMASVNKLTKYEYGYKRREKKTRLDKKNFTIWQFEGLNYINYF